MKNVERGKKGEERFISSVNAITAFPFLSLSFPFVLPSNVEFSFVLTTLSPIYNDIDVF